ncbi:hypothetical protein DVH24_003221 [Malus domestica]|uniref:Replication protein A OB domain-containing protein n=1 Tax=Malus domestica TaxID=3750 RepID=A0A498INB5_MALDO|nr:hypothetical protein DVH24_003221 [Malus domestica]
MKVFAFHLFSLSGISFLNVFQAYGFVCTEKTKAMIVVLRSSNYKEHSFSLKIEPGGSYEITNFRTTRMKGQYNVVPHETQLIFNGKTNFKKLSKCVSTYSSTPDYNTLYPHLNKVDILTGNNIIYRLKTLKFIFAKLFFTTCLYLPFKLEDVIGHLTAIQHLEPKQINQRVAYKCDIHIQNVRRQQLTVTLWGDVAEEFCSSSVQALPLPIVVIFTSLKVKLYLDKIVMNSTDCSLLLFDPNIPEVNAYKSVFANCNEPVKILAPFSRQVNEAEILRTTKMFTIDEVAFLDLDLHKNDTFFCKVCVKCFDTRYQWWYSAYANCVKQMHKDLTTGQLICQKHPNQIPTPWYKVNLVLEHHTNEINALIIGKSGEKLFGVPCKDLVVLTVENQNFIWCPKKYTVWFISICKKLFRMFYGMQITLFTRNLSIFLHVHTPALINILYIIAGSG